jgi:hemerythrin-like domain-containing protein
MTAAILNEALALARHDPCGDLDRDVLRGLRQSLEAFEVRICRNIHLENNVLYPRAARLEEEQAS